MGLDHVIIEAVEEFVATPWVYLALFAIAKLDGFFPVVPSETLVITLGVFAASNSEPNILIIIAVAAVGAFAGDHISYFIGRKSGPRIMAKVKPGSRTQKAYDRVGHMLEKRGGLVLISARYIPGGRTAATLTTGATRYPLRNFSKYDAIAAISWATYSALIGYIGGAAFEENPLRGLAMGLGLALAITIGHEVIRVLYERRKHRRAGLSAAGGGSDSDSGRVDGSDDEPEAVPPAGASAS
ncbi:DedA family protein [Streptomyces sp. 4N509B]|uniref:DedA family protein n=1 Tax=Streptomyces sp. 4N509B TaxID=3457413 RepID=UPI003FD33128